MISGTLQRLATVHAFHAISKVGISLVALANRSRTELHLKMQGVPGWRQFPLANLCEVF
jgi:hypothetical protein